VKTHRGKIVPALLFLGAILTAAMPSDTYARDNAVERNIIVEEAKHYGVSTHLALALGFVESNYDPEIKNPSSTATGLFQFLTGTWARYCEGERTDARDNARCAMRMISEGGLGHWLADPTVLPKLLKEGVARESITRYSRKEIALK